MSTSRRYDAIVIGAGQAGVPLARAFAEAGRQTALVEREHVGGTCVNVGCTPTKTMVASARIAYLTGRGAEYGAPNTRLPMDMATVRQRKRDIVESFRGGSERRLLRQENLDLIRGQATFTGLRGVEVTTSEGGVEFIEADRIVINAGARPAVPSIAGLADVPFLDSTSIMELDTVPEHLIVVGAGYVGLEFAQMFRRFGSRVTVVHRSGHVLGREDDDVVRAVEEILRDEGLDFIFNADVDKVERREDGGVVLSVRVAGETQTVTGSHLLVATGRVPNSDRLNTAAAGVELDSRGFIKVNERLETSAPGIYAAGDINGGPAFTHISYDDFRILEANLIRGESRTTSGRLVPYTVFIDPQLGRVGITEAEAVAQSLSVKVAKMPMTHVARALETAETRGFMKAIVDAGSGQILGCAVLGMEGGEVMGALQIAMMGRIPYTALRDGVFAHPTLLESLNNLFMTLD